MYRLFLGVFEVFIVTFTHRDLSKISMGKFTICQMFLDLQVNPSKIADLMVNC